ncbi:hypothetical protein JCM10449v2_000750 [Rhodotorula kratochvilovae]
MPYLDDGAPSEELSLVFLPARGAGAAMAVSSVASLVAVVFLSRLAVGTSLETSHNVLIAFTGGTFLVFVCTGLIIAYARFLPPPTSRIWDLVRSVTSYLALLWIVCFALSGALLGEVLLPLMSCTQPYPTLCLTEIRSQAIHVLVVLSLALAASLALCILVSLDLHSTHPEARVVILRSELAAQRAQDAQRRRIARYQAGMDALAGEPLLASGAGTSDEEAPDSFAGRQEASKQATVRAFLARARLPVDDPEAAFPSPVARAPPPPASTPRLVPPPSTSKDALGVPAMFSPGKRSERDRSRSHSRSRRRRDDNDDDGEPPRHHRRRRAEDDDEDTDASSLTSSSDDDETTETSLDKPSRRATPRHRRHPAPPSPEHHTHHHHHRPSDEDDDEEERKREERRRRRRRKEKKRQAEAGTTNLNATRMEAASVSGGGGGGDVVA